jgi:hypothetical protein
VDGGVDGGSLGGVGGVGGIGASGALPAASAVFTFASTNEFGVSPARRHPARVTVFSSIFAGSVAFRF